MPDEPDRTPDAARTEVDYDDLMARARWIASRECNRDGTDKTYVFKMFESMRRFAQFARNAKRVELHD